MENPNPNSPAPEKLKLVMSDYLFFCLMFTVLVSVVWIGILSFEEAMKTEESKRNGEELVAWMTEAGTKRFSPEFDLAACAGGLHALPTEHIAEPAPTQKADESALGTEEEDAPKHAAPVVEKAAASTWGACVEKMMKLPPFEKMSNPFVHAPPKFVPACVPTDGELPGTIVIEKLVATPPGSSVPYVNSPLVEADSIGEKMQLRVSICDKGSYAIKIAEFDF